MGLFAFVWPDMTDAASIVLVAGTIYVALRWRINLQTPPFVLSCIWIAFIVFAAMYATLENSPGNQFRSLEKHLPIALGPIGAIVLTVACNRLRINRDRLIVLFLSGLIAGATLVLLCNGMLDVLAHGNPDAGALGKLNRNYAALACGISLISIAALVVFLSGSGRMRKRWRASVIVILVSIFLSEGILLVMLESRTGYAATALGLVVWCVLTLRAGARGASRSPGLIVAAAIVAIATFGVAYYFSLISNRISADGSTAVYLRELAGLVQGHAMDSASLSAAGSERLQLIAVALDLIHQRPWLGWGPNASQLVALFSPYPGIRNLNQFHNGYLEFLVSFGAGGGVLIAALIGVLIWSAFRRGRSVQPDNIAPPLFAAMIGLMAYILVTNVTESAIFVKPVGFICMFVAALACMRDRAATADVIEGRLTAQGQDESHILR
ncbi:MAG: hypothetical protein BGN84_15770 [Afipia sp. 62-7]|nr:MAG: hypothetical protein BGN84_15770 [Afipia sp. 62-7]